MQTEDKSVIVVTKSNKTILECKDFDSSILISLTPKEVIELINLLQETIK